MERPSRLKPREQGDLGEAAAIAWLVKSGARVSVPLLNSPDYDLIAEVEGTLLRVQVKTCARQHHSGYEVQLATYGGNQSWNRALKFFDHSRCDALFVLIADGRRWFLPSIAVDGRRGIVLGGKKYAEYEVDPTGAPAFAFSSALESHRRGSADVGESGQTVNLVPRAERVRIPPPPSSRSVLVQGELTASWPPPRDSRTSISPKHQITIPVAAFRAAELQVGDRLAAGADGPGRVILESLQAKLRNDSNQEAAPMDRAASATGSAEPVSPDAG